MRVSENKILRRIFGNAKEEGKGGWRKLRGDKVNNPFSLLNIIRQIKLRKGCMKGPYRMHRSDKK
jgi:hypothetical protein